jgi:hypothetical protein
MNLRQSISVDLPAPRDDEPAGLRRDIFDELADHLACSYKRELLRGVDAAEAEASALERFGDPSAVARRLWLDAMKERIMLQRVVVASCLVVMLTCVGFTAMAWVQMNRSRVAAELERTRAAFEVASANRRMVDALVESQATNKALLGQIGKISETLRHPRSSDWNPVRFKLVSGRGDGPPVAGASAHLDRSGQPSITRASDNSGIVDFGVVQPGDYSFLVIVGWEGGTAHGSGVINVQPGREVDLTVICPKTPPDRAPVSVRCQLPSDLESQNIALCADFVHRGQRLEPGVNWVTYVAASAEVQELNGGPAHTAEGLSSTSSTTPDFDLPARSLICGRGPELIWTKNKGVHIWARIEVDIDRAIREVQGHGRGLRADVLDSDIVSRSGTAQMEVGTYSLSRLLALRPIQSGDVPAGRRRYEVLAVCLTDPTDSIVDFFGEVPTKDFDWKSPVNPTDTQQAPALVALRLRADYWAKAVFAARPDQPNEWTIPVPDEFIKAVRNRLAEDSGSQSKPASETPKSKP